MYCNSEPTSGNGIFDGWHIFDTPRVGGHHTRVKISSDQFRWFRFPQFQDMKSLCPDLSQEEIYQYIRILSQLPICNDIILRFIDFDDVLTWREPELLLDGWLREHRGDSVYSYINERYKLDGYIRRYHTDGNAIFDNVWLALEGMDWNQRKEKVILTAGKYEHQVSKILANGFWWMNRIVVPKASIKMKAILDYVIRLGYIPWKVQFIDDRIDAFVDKTGVYLDLPLSRILWIPVEFERAVPRWPHLEIQPIWEVRRKVKSTLH